MVSTYHDSAYISKLGDYLTLLVLAVFALFSDDPGRLQQGAHYEPIDMIA